MCYVSSFGFFSSGPPFRPVLVRGASARYKSREKRRRSHGCSVVVVVVAQVAAGVASFFLFVSFLFLLFFPSRWISSNLFFRTTQNQLALEKPIRRSSLTQLVSRCSAAAAATNLLSSPRRRFHFRGSKELGLLVIRVNWITTSLASFRFFLLSFLSRRRRRRRPAEVALSAQKRPRRLLPCCRYHLLRVLALAQHRQGQSDRLDSAHYFPRIARGS